MKKPALIIQELSIYKMPGFPAGMKPITSLASHVNVIAGPNASGKSSTARIIQDMIWKQNIQRIHVESRLAIDGRIWDIKIDNGHYSSQCDGVDDTLTSLPAYDESKRYFLALHELIKEDDKNLAQEILRETIGGYDLQKAQQTLGFKGTTPNLGLPEYKDYESKRKQVIDIESKQIHLKNEQNKLSTLKEEYEEVKKASKLRFLYAYLIDFLKAKKDYQRLKDQIASFPQQMRFLQGNEVDECAKLERKIEGANQSIEGVVQERKAKEVELLALQLPREGYDRIVLDELSEHVDTLSTLERNLESKRIDIRKNEAETSVALSRLFTNIKSEDLEALDLEDIHDLNQFFGEAHRLLTKEKTLKDEIQHLNNEKQELYHTEEDLHAGIRILLNWFQREVTASGSSKQSVWVLLGFGALTVPLTYFLGWFGFIGVLAMFLYILFKEQHAHPDSLRKTRVSDFNKTGLREPASWQEAEVSKRLEELHQELHEAKQQNEITYRLKDLNKSLNQIAPELQTLEVKREAWIAKLSEIPELRVQNIESYSGLYWLLSNLQQWQKHNNELRANRLSYEEENKSYLKTLDRINSILTQCHLAPACDSASARAIFKTMIANENKRAALIRDIEGLDKRKIVFKELNEKNEEEIRLIYQRLHLEVGQKEELITLLSKKEDYTNFHKEFGHAEHRLAEKEKQLQDLPMYVEIQEELSTFQIEDAEERKEHYSDLASKAEELNAKIATIEAHINREKAGQELEIVLTEKELLLDKLEQNYLNTIASITGDVIVNGLKKRTQEHSTSKVFNRANELFNKITHGHYELILDDKEGGNFRAKDTVLNQGLPLDYLSSGTRIQLLIAVRLAFIESQESGVKLPILADEVLANSDDLRAKQIIEALVEISKEGRQVFYFTAQSDELKKWKEYIDKHPEINGQIIILKGQENAPLSYQLVEQREAPVLSFANLPAPGMYSNEEYHNLLRPPAYSLLKGRPEALYLSYLIEDNKLLYACLQRGIHYYGQLNSFIKHKGEIDGLDASKIEEINRKVKLLESYQELYQKGRHKPIDREVLIDSGSVSNTFIDAVTGKLKELDHQPERLITSLKAGEVARFSRAKIQELEDYLFEQNHLDRDERLTEEELSIQLQALLSRMELSAIEAERFLKRVVEQEII